MTKKADMVRHPSVQNHIGLFVNKPPAIKPGCFLSNHPTPELMFTIPIGAPLSLHCTTRL
jgi:hypothetical protein